jgi:hypothetical protein
MDGLDWTGWRKDGLESGGWRDGGMDHGWNGRWMDRWMDGSWPVKNVTEENEERTSRAALGSRKASPLSLFSPSPLPQPASSSRSRGQGQGQDPGGADPSRDRGLGVEVSPEKMGCLLTKKSGLEQGASYLLSHPSTDKISQDFHSMDCSTVCVQCKGWRRSMEDVAFVKFGTRKCLPSGPDGDKNVSDVA